MPLLPEKSALFIFQRRLPWAWMIETVALVLGLANTGWGSTNDCTWNSTSGNWSNASDWNPTVAPNDGGGVLNDVTISAGTVMLDMDPTIQQLNLSGGAISGAGILTVDDTFTWSAGRIGSESGSALTVNANGGMNISASVGMYGGTTINNSAAATWSTGAFYATGNDVVGQNTTFNNLSGATLNVESAGCYYANGSLSAAPDVFNNAGIVNKGAGGDTIIYAEFNNNNVVNVQPGVLSLYGGGSQTGSFYVGTGATLELGEAPNAFQSGSSVGGAGGVYFSSSETSFNPGSVYDPAGSTQITSSIVNFNSSGVSISGPLMIQNGVANFNTGGTHITPSSISLDSGTLTGTDAISTAGLFSWTGGTLGAIGSSQTFSASGMSINGNVTFAGGTINNTGTATWSGGSISATGQNVAGQNTVFNNQSGAIFNAQCNETYSGNGSGSAAADQFNNAGTFNKVYCEGAPGTTEIDAQFNNSGVVNVQWGTLDLAGGGLQTGGFNVSSGSTLQFDRGSFHFASGAGFSGGGNVVFGSGITTLDSASTFNPTGTITVSGGAFMAKRGTANSSGGFVQTGGVTQMDGTLTTPSVNISGGMFEGGGNVACTTNFDNDGAVRPGDSPGMLAIDGNYSQDAGGELDIGLGGNAAGQFDVLDVSGEADLGGTLDVSLLNSFVLLPGERFTILTASAGFNGTTFGNVIALPGIGVEYEGDSVELIVDPPVPEPASLAPLALAACGLMMRRSGRSG